MDVHQIWENIKSGQKEALKQLYDLYHPQLYAYGKKMVKDGQMVEDAIQETFIAVWKYRENVSVPAVIKQYLLKSFRNQLFLQIKKHSGTVDFSGNIPGFSFEVSFDQKLIENEDTNALAALINSALQQLTARQREIIYYRFYESLSFEEIAQAMDMKIRATYKLTARALQSLRKVLHSSASGILMLHIFTSFAQFVK